MPASAAVAGWRYTSSYGPAQRLRGQIGRLVHPRQVRPSVEEASQPPRMSDGADLSASGAPCAPVLLDHAVLPLSLHNSNSSILVDLRMTTPPTPETARRCRQGPASSRRGCASGAHAAPAAPRGVAVSRDDRLWDANASAHETGPTVLAGETRGTCRGQRSSGLSAVASRRRRSLGTHAGPPPELTGRKVKPPPTAFGCSGYGVK